MNKIILLAAAAAIAVPVGQKAIAATPARSHLASVRQVAPFAFRDRKATVLYDQSANDSLIGIVSQAFEAADAQYDSQAADDFTVPTGKKWTVSEVDVVGQYFNGTGPATSENVFFYKVKKGLPGKQVIAIQAVVGKDNGTGSFAIKLPKAVKLKAGTYFVSVQANLAFSAGGEWGWDTTTSGGTTFGSPAVWENPQDGFATGCKKYTVETTCIPDGQGSDHIFTILGKSN